MSVYIPATGAVPDGSGGLQLVDIGNTGSMKEIQVANLEGLQHEGSINGMSKFVLAVPEGQPATAGNILHQIALSAAADNKLNAIHVPQHQQQMEQRERATNHRMSLRANPPAAQNTDDVVQIQAAPAEPKPRRRSRKQRMPGSSLAASLPDLNQQPQLVQVPLVQQIPMPSKREKRKRKSPVRSTLADTFGEPEFVEMYYFEESENEEDDGYAGNVIHLMKERQRRREMTGQFDGLAALVAPHEDKVSRNVLLTKSTKMVKALTQKASQLRIAKNTLQDMNISLRNRLAGLLGVTTDINYESEEEEVEKVGGYCGYKSSSSDPDNNDDDDDVILDWGGSIDSDEEDDDDVIDIKEEESDEETRQDFKVELPEEEEEDYGGGDGDDEADDAEDSKHGVRVKDEPVSDDEQEQNSRDTTHRPAARDKSQTDVLVRVKLEPGPTDEASLESVATETSAEPTAAAIAASPKSRHQTDQRGEEEEDLFDRYDRVKIEPRSPVRRALFADSENQVDSAEDQALDENVLVAASLGMDSLQALKMEADDEDDDGDDLSHSIAPMDPLEEIRINVDPGLLVKQDDDDDSMF